MQIVKVNKNSVLLAGRILRSGVVIVYPTDTAYALGGIFDNKKVIKKILAIKKRKDDKFTLIASSIGQVENFFLLSPMAKKLAKKYWPGPLSLVVSKKYAVRVPDNAIARKLARLAGKPLVATSANMHGEQTPYSVRGIIRSFITSPNPSFVRRGKPRKLLIFSPLTKGRRGVGKLLLSSLSLDGRGAGVRVVKQRICPDLILDAGKLEKRKTSTIVEVSGDEIKIIRQGAIKL